MHHRSGRGSPAPPRPRRRPQLAVLVGALALALAVGGCAAAGDQTDGVASLNGSTTTTRGGTTGASKDPRQAALDFARCMRQHGINMPDPKFDAGGRITQEFRAGPGSNGPDSQKFKQAQQACQQYQPSGGQLTRPNAQEQQQMLQFARCMRQHGVNLPDPKPGGGIAIDGDLLNVKPDSPEFKAAEQACQQYMPNGGERRTSSGDGR